MHRTENITSRRDTLDSNLNSSHHSKRKLYLIIARIIVILLVIITTIVIVRSTKKNETKFVGIQFNSKWKQHGITVAGGNGRGNQTNQLNRPQGIFIDKDKTIYIADNFNSRIIQWKYGETINGESIIGEHGKGLRMDQLYSPVDIIVNKTSDILIIADDANRRVMQWSIQNKSYNQNLISDIDCWGVIIDKDESIYVSSRKNHEVKRWKKGEKQGEIVAGGNGQGTGLNQLDGPTFIFVDGNYSIYISDEKNHRVVKWTKGATKGIIVAGTDEYGDSLGKLSYPEGLFVDRWGRIYVADFNNHRIMRWKEGDTEGEIIVGGNGYGDELNQLGHPTGLAFDMDGNLYVADKINDRVQKFEIYIE